LTLAFAALWVGVNDQPFRLLLTDIGLCGALLGMGVLAAFALRREAPRLTLVGAAGIPGFMLVQGWFRDRIAGGLPLTYDAVLLNLDRALGLDPAYAVGRWFVASPFLAASSALFYAALPLLVALVFAAAVRGGAPRSDPVRLLLICGAVQLVGAMLYRLVPAVGPRYVFGGFPLEVPLVAPVLLAPFPEYPRNAVPSVHFALAIVLLRASRGGTWIFPISLIWCVAIGLATLGMGEHYLIDLVIAVPFALGIEAAVERRGLARPAVAGLLMAAWIAVVRTLTIPPPAAGWAAMVATVVVGCALVLQPPAVRGTVESDGRGLGGRLPQGAARR
jgi:hypothetical protein